VHGVKEHVEIFQIAMYHIKKFYLIPFVKAFENVLTKANVQYIKCDAIKNKK
jgi:hypothetical protein